MYNIELGLYICISYHLIYFITTVYKSLKFYARKTKHCSLMLHVHVQYMLCYHGQWSENCNDTKELITYNATTL